MTRNVLAILLFGLIAGPFSLNAHDLPDGTVKIATQVVVRPKVTQVKYDIGFNPKTLKLILDHAGVDSTGEYEKQLIEFRKHYKESLPKTLTLKMNDVEIKPNDEISVSNEELSKHNQVRIILTYSNPKEAELSIQLSDTSFQNLDRIYNTGFKTQGDQVAVTESSTEAIPIRSKPDEVEAGKKDAYVISGKVKRLDGSHAVSGNQMPLLVLMAVLGAAGFVGLLLVPGGLEDEHDHH